MSQVLPLSPEPEDRSDFPTPAESIDVVFDEPLQSEEQGATPVHLPSPLTQHRAVLTFNMKEALRAWTAGDFKEVSELLQEALLVRQRAERILNAEDLAELPDVSSIQMLLTGAAIFTEVQRVRTASVLDLVDGWSLWSQSGTWAASLERAMADLSRGVKDVAIVPRLLEKMREGFYHDLRLKRPATYGHPLLDPPHLRM